MRDPGAVWLVVALVLFTIAGAIASPLWRLFVDWYAVALAPCANCGARHPFRRERFLVVSTKGAEERVWWRCRACRSRRARPPRWKPPAPHPVIDDVYGPDDAHEREGRRIFGKDDDS